MAGTEGTEPGSGSDAPMHGAEERSGHAPEGRAAGSAEAVGTGPGAESPAHEEPNYMGVWLGLFLLTMAEVGVAFVTAFPKQVIVLILIGLAIWKALLVALYYMHLRFEPSRLRMVVLAPLPLGVIMVLAILMEYT